MNSSSAPFITPVLNAVKVLKEKIEYLAQRLEEASAETERLESVDDENKALLEERNDFEQKWLAAEEENTELRSEIKKLKQGA